MISSAPLRSVAATRYVTPLRQGGSLPGLVEADDDGLYVAKFTGAGQGPRALAAEIVGGELARALGLAVPEIVTVEIDPALGRAEPDPEIQELLLASPGTNLAIDFLPGAVTFSPAAGWTPDGDLAADVVWLDALITNVDRTPRNPNLLVWYGDLWLIDHGAALYLQHGGLKPAEHASRPFPQIADHVLLGCASSIRAADERLAARVDRALLDEVVGRVPEDWLVDSDAATYAEYLERRLDGPRAFVDEAEVARAAA